jgi:AcrR family transcriptional regulator
MRDLAQRVGMEAASLYNHIKSKEDLLTEVCFMIGNLYMSQLEQIEQMEAGSVEKLKALIGLHVAVVAEHMEAAEIANHEFRHLSKAHLGRYLEMRRVYEARIEKLISEGIAKGELAPVNPAMAKYTILSALRWIGLWYKNNQNFNAAVVEANLCDILLGGLQQNKNNS